MLQTEINLIPFYVKSLLIHSSLYVFYYFDHNVQSVSVGEGLANEFIEEVCVSPRMNSNCGVKALSRL